MKRAFTLAEVLITLAIIGVVAAITIPSVVQKSSKQQYVTGLQKAWSTLKTVEKTAIAEHGPVKYWNWNLMDDYTNDENVTLFFNTYFKPYFDVLKDCGMEPNKGCCQKGRITQLDGKTVMYSNADERPPNTYRLVTADNIIYTFRALNIDAENEEGWAVSPFSGIFITVDVNGKKGPNAVGRDIFAFRIYSKGSLGIRPYNSISSLTDSGDARYYTSTETIHNNCISRDVPPKGNQNHYCAAKVLAEGAMNY